MPSKNNDKSKLQTKNDISDIFISTDNKSKQNKYFAKKVV